MANLRVDKITSTETFETTGSVQFDGTGDYLNIADSDDLDFGSEDFTIECWIYPSGSGGSTFNIFYNKGVDLQCYWKSDTNRIDVFADSNGGTDYDILNTLSTPSGSVNSSQWTHVAIVRSSNTFQIYLNGSASGSPKTSTSAIGSNSTDATIGDYKPDLTKYEFNGHISNVRVLKGVALYTSNFKPSMRELEVVPDTVLLCCQSKTDASLEKTGKTITVLGSASANELTPGILTPVVKSGGGSAITGSVEFDGSGDYLTIPNTEDLRLADSDFTIELWATISKVDSTYSPFALFENSTALRSYQLEVRANGAVRFEWWYNGSSANDITTGTGAVIVNEWYHYAVSRNGATIKLFINGIEVGSADAGANAFFNNTVTPFIIGGMFQSGVHQQKWQGNISNFRINKGTALYTVDFIPPTRELKKVPGTVLLCCQDENSVTTEITGKTITSNGDPTASNFTPQVGDDRQVTFEGVTKIDTDAYFYLPTGNTESRTLNVATQASSSARGVFMGGLSSAPSGSVQDVMDYVTVTSTGNAADFGNLTAATRISSSCSSTTRGVRMGGFSDPATVDVIDYVTIASTGDAQDFGNLTSAKHSIGGSSNSTRGLSFGSSGLTNIIEYITIASTGDSKDFGDMVDGLGQVTGTASPTRCVMAGGESPSRLNTMQYVTIMSMGNAFDFGDLTIARSGIVSLSSATRGLYLGGELPASPTFTNTVDFVQIATTGNAINFGDLDNSTGMRLGATAASPTRGLYAGGGNDQPVSNTAFTKIHLFTIASTGNATDFGDITVARFQMNNGTVSSGHGGLG